MFLLCVCMHCVRVMCVMCECVVWGVYVVCVSTLGCMGGWTMLMHSEPDEVISYAVLSYLALLF